MYKERCAGVESVIGGAPGKKKRKTFHTSLKQRNPLGPTERVERMKKVVYEAPRVPLTERLDGGIILE